MEDANAAARTDVLTLTVDVVAAYVSNNNVPVAELPSLVRSVHGALAACLTGTAAEAPSVPAKPAVPVGKSITPEYIVCLDDGKKLKSLKRHLTALGMTPEQYRARWDLPADYPMVAPSYSARRSALAKSIGLGQVGGRVGKDEAEEAAKPPVAANEAVPEAKAPGKSSRAKAATAAEPVREAARSAKGDATKREPRARKAA